MPSRRPTSGARVQAGGRLERNAYRPDARDVESGLPGEPTAPAAVDRNFTGASGSAGLHVDLGGRAAMVVNVSRSYRAPALEELYNFGPHTGNLAFEIGNSSLKNEASTGLDVSLRSRAARVRGELNAYYYRIGNFVFPDFTGDIIDGLRAAVYEQGDSRFAGVDFTGRLELAKNAWVNVNAGYVNAELVNTGTPLPRIPPLHASLDLDVPIGPFTISPDIHIGAAQKRVYVGETTTDGSTVVGLGVSYAVTRAHVTHLITFRGDNLTNETYRSHTSFIKDLAPEMGRGVKVSYSVRFF
ncbi:MAG: TonB-dependent receptor [Vicinamibacterales bacterium]